MEYRLLGKTGIEVSRLGLGAAQHGDLDVPDEQVEWPVDTWQFTYNFLSQEAASELIPVLREEGIGTIVKRPMSNVVWAWEQVPENDFYQKPLQRARQWPLQELAGGLPLVEFALRFVLSHPDVDVALSGTISAEHLEENVRYAERGPLPGEQVERAHRLFEEQFA